MSKWISRGRFCLLVAPRISYNVLLPNIYICSATFGNCSKVIKFMQFCFTQAFLRLGFWQNLHSLRICPLHTCHNFAFDSSSYMMIQLYGNECRCNNFICVCQYECVNHYDTGQVHFKVLKSSLVLDIATLDLQ